MPPEPSSPPARDARKRATYPAAVPAAIVAKREGEGTAARVVELLGRVEELVASMEQWPGLMSQTTAARYLDTTPNTLRLWRLRSGLPFCELPSTAENGKRGVMIRYRRRDLDAWATERRRKARPSES